MLLGFMRYGKPLGLLNWETDKISLLDSGNVEISEEFEHAVERGEFIEPEDPVEPQDPGMWQDKVIAVVSSFFGILLLPQLYETIYNGATMSPVTAYSTAAGLAIMAICYYTMKMKLATATSLLSALVWLLLGVFG